MTSLLGAFLGPAPPVMGAEIFTYRLMAGSQILPVSNFEPPPPTLPQPEPMTGTFQVVSADRSPPKSYTILNVDIRSEHFSISGFGHIEPSDCGAAAFSIGAYLLISVGAIAQAGMFRDVIVNETGTDPPGFSSVVLSGSVNLLDAYLLSIHALPEGIPTPVATPTPRPTCTLTPVPEVTPTPPSPCAQCPCVGDRDGNGEVTVDEVVNAVNNVLLGCPPP